MTKDQINFREYFQEVMKDHDEDVFRAIYWWLSHGKYLYMNHRDVFVSYQRLSSRQKNQVVSEVLSFKK